MNLRQAKLQLIDKPMLQTQTHKGYQNRADRSGVHPDVLLFERAFIRECAREGWPLYCHTAIRSFDKQEELYADGHTKARGGSSPHQHGFAVDIVHSVHQWDLDKNAWFLLGHVGHEVARRLGIEMEWGGNWNFYDPAHWELKDWQTRLDVAKPMNLGMTPDTV